MCTYIYIYIYYVCQFARAPARSRQDEILLWLSKLSAKAGSSRCHAPTSPHSLSLSLPPRDCV